MTRPLMGFRQLCAVTKELRQTRHYETDADWKFDIKQRVTELDYASPPSDQVHRAMDAVNRLRVRAEARAAGPLRSPDEMTPQEWTEHERLKHLIPRGGLTSPGFFSLSVVLATVRTTLRERALQHSKRGSERRDD